MAEIDISRQEFFRFAERDKGHICQVAGCRKKRKRNDRICACHYQAFWRACNPLTSSYCSLRDRAKRRRIPFALTLEEFSAIVVPAGWLDAKGKATECLQLDRIDVTKGYEVGNLRVIPAGENIAKGNRERHVKIRLSDGRVLSLQEYRKECTRVQNQAVWPEEDSWLFDMGNDDDPF